MTLAVEGKVALITGAGQDQLGGLLLRKLPAFGLVSLRDGIFALRLALLVGAGFSHSPVSLLGSLAVPVGSLLL